LLKFRWEYSLAGNAGTCYYVLRSCIVTMAFWANTKRARGRENRQPTLMIRVANARHNTLSNASATLWLIRAEQTAEGQHLRGYYQLKQLRQENPVFALTWTIFHVIDQTSPLFGLTADDLASTDD
jgi:hypothetical protein